MNIKYIRTVPTDTSLTHLQYHMLAIKSLCIQLHNMVILMVLIFLLFRLLGQLGNLSQTPKFVCQRLSVILVPIGKFNN